jgi:iron(III) transport system permease protein
MTGWRRLWRPGLYLLALTLSLPVLTVASRLFQPAGDNWTHLRQTVLPEYLANSAWLVLGVGIGVLLMGVSTAWLTAMCRFPGKGLFSWALLLPLAMPAYIIAYTYTGMLDFAGPVQTALRDLTGWGYGDYWFPPIRSLGGAIAMLTLVLYPYVYLLARAAFLEQSICVLEVSRTLGCGAWCSFFRVALPLARPALVAGLSLALMETLADYGTVAYFGIPVFTTGIFRTWFGMGDSIAAARLSALLLLLVFSLMLLERLSRRQARYHHTTGRYSRLPQYRLHGWQLWLAIPACTLPVLLGFLLPALQLGHWAWISGPEALDATFWGLVGNSLGLAAVAAFLALLLALSLGYGQRLMPGRGLRLASRVATLGYAVPGAVIAVGVLIPLAAFDNALDRFLREAVGVSSGLLLSGSLFALVFAYLVRFLAVSLQTVESGLGKIRPSMDEAARVLGYRPRETLQRIHLPLMKGSVLTALLIVFVDVMKELPATLILRPFDFNTLAVRAFELASDERLADSSTAALAIVAVGLLPVIYLSRSIAHSRAGHE